MQLKDEGTKKNHIVRMQKRARLHLAMSTRELLDKIKDNNSRPQMMSYFDERFKSLYENSGDLIKTKDRQKVIGVYCMFVPEELIYAAGAVPVRLCAGAYDSIDAGGDFLPDIACPIIKSTIGLWHLQILPFYNSCDVVIIPATCDWKTKLGEIIKEYVPVWMMDVPRVKETEASRRHWLAEVKELKQKIEKLTGEKITRRKLRQAIKAVQGAQAEFRRFYKIRMAETPAIKGVDALLVMNAYFYETVENWTKAVRALNDEMEDRLQKGVHVCKSTAPRIMLTGAPIIFPNYKLPAIIEEMGGILVTDELCNSNRYIYDMVAVDEPLMFDILAGIAERYLLPCSCPIFTTTEDRIKRILQMIEDFRVEGLVYHVLKGCHPYDLEAIRIENALKEKDIPMLKIETDYSPEDIEQLRTRIEAFLETIKGMRHTGRKIPAPLVLERR
jgi:benzoyl-CoA reductase/2-hydroxyglutaryl-CoA dehydratase subunit BcrC/BadD/HgdB